MTTEKLLNHQLTTISKNTFELRDKLIGLKMNTVEKKKTRIDLLRRLNFIQDRIEHINQPAAIDDQTRLPFDTEENARQLADIALAGRELERKIYQSDCWHQLYEACLALVRMVRVTPDIYANGVGG